MIRQIRSLLYEHGFTVGGARLRLSAGDTDDVNGQTKQVIRQVLAELEDVLVMLRR